jgi:hypothetical protein
MVFLESFYSFLLIVHLLGVFALAGCMVHNIVIVIGYIKGKFDRRKRELSLMKWTLRLYLAVYVFGAIIYPAFVVYIRRPFFDGPMPWMTGLFEVKEHWAVIGLVLMFVCYFVRKSFDPKEEKHKLFLYVPLCVIFNITTWYVIISGCYLSIIKGTW